MKLKFWEKDKEIVEAKPKAGSFLFATEINDLMIMSVERKEDATELIFLKDGVFNPHTYHRFHISVAQHEDFIQKLSQNIKCVVIPVF
jgi:hypothetical protein